MLDANQKNTASLMHFSALGKYFFPFGNLIFPLILWILFKEKSDFCDKNGKASINFQLSFLLYGLIIGAVAIGLMLYFVFDHLEVYETAYTHKYFFNHDWMWPPFVPFGMLVLIGCVGLAYLIFDFFVIVSAGLKAQKGEVYRYPLSIPFIK
ncbi:MAG: DUF4870 domain-containing protein [Flavobacteriaceae bacterium]|nr:DUF4870 domain-containing protein [Flavobacteriaceae bacterium]